MTPMTSPMATVVPSATRISLSTPPAMAGMSVSILSVVISTTDSSRSMESPTCFSQRMTVPSSTLSPSLGITMFTGVILFGQ